MSYVFFRPFTPSYPLKLFFSDIKTALCSCMKKTDELFSRVHVDKVKWGSHVNQTYIKDIQTGDLYYDEPLNAIREKCLAISIVVPFYAIGFVMWYLYQTVRSTAIIAQKIFQETHELFNDQKYFQVAQITNNAVQLLFEDLKQRWWYILLTPCFTLAIELVAFCALFKPYSMRKIEAMLEKAWHGGVSYTRDIRKITGIYNMTRSDCMAYLREIHRDRVFYLAYCFQARGNVSEVKVIKTEPL